MKNIVLFASGTGSNAENIIRFFSANPQVKIAAVFSNNQTAGVLEKAAHFNIPTVIFTKEELNNGSVERKLKAFNPALIVLAGFLLQFPAGIIQSFPNKIINIHPALLPKYGGKGMYGTHVHASVLANGETQSGISIHFVDEQYDNGDLIFQQSIDITDCATADDVAKKIQQLEHEHFPAVIEKLLR